MFSDVIKNQSSERFSLVRLLARRKLEITLLSGTTYTANISGLNFKDLYNGTTLLTEVSGTPSSDEYSISSGVVTLNVSTVLQIIAEHYLLFSSSQNTVIGIDPETPGTDLKDWLPVLTSEPSVTSTIGDISNGTFSISNMSISLVNDDISNFLGKNDSIKDSECFVWMCVDGTENIKKIYDGLCDSVSFDEYKITITLRDRFAGLLNPATLESDPNKAYARIEDFPNINPDQNGTPIPMITGSVSRYQLAPLSFTGLSTAQKINHESLYRAICVSFNTDLQVTNNRDWIACRMLKSHTGRDHIPTNIDNTNPNYTKFTATSDDMKTVYTGDGILVNGQYGIVVYVDYDNNQYYSEKLSTATTGMTVFGHVTSALFLESSDGIFQLLPWRDYSSIAVDTYGDNWLVTIQLEDNFEANHPGITKPINPGEDILYYRVKPTPTSAKEVIQKLIETAEIPVNNSSFSDFYTAFSVNCAFSMPNYDESDFSQIVLYLQDLLKSCGAYIYLDENFECCIGLLDNPSGSTAPDYMKDSLSYRLDYKDIVASIIAHNPHMDSFDHVQKTGITATSNTAKYLHKSTKTIKFKHVLEDITSRIQYIANLNGNRRLNASAILPIEHVESLLGSDLLLDNSDFRIVETSKNVENIGIRADDLLSE
jgi:hypothetical protein